MKYNFDKIANRRNTSSIKWDVKDNELPMWVADMDFLVMPEIQDAICEAAKTNGFGYTYPTKEYFEAYRYWWSSRHHVSINASSMIFVSGVVSALDSIIRKLTNEDELYVRSITSALGNLIYHKFNTSDTEKSFISFIESILDKFIDNGYTDRFIMDKIK